MANTTNPFLLFHDLNAADSGDTLSGSMFGTDGTEVTGTLVDPRGVVAPAVPADGFNFFHGGFVQDKSNVAFPVTFSNPLITGTLEIGSEIPITVDPNDLPDPADVRGGVVFGGGLIGTARLERQTTALKIKQGDAYDDTSHAKFVFDAGKDIDGKAFRLCVVDCEGNEIFAVDGLGQGNFARPSIPSSKTVMLDPNVLLSYRYDVQVNCGPDSDETIAEGEVCVSSDITPPTST